MRAATGGGISRRRAILVALGAGWAGYGGLGILLNPRADTTRMLDHITRWVSMPALGWMWVSAGAVGILAGLVLRCPRIQASGYAVLAAVAGLWGAAFTLAIPAYPTAAGSACIWVGIATAVVLAAGMDDPPPAHLRKARRWT
ncbi:hypothetical protein ACFVUB_10975 [Streptomyces niveus]|uniref:hypothetical protein n=1 Tax=Streptomyces niveus TaxID=193462 RepID=UPI0036D9C19D